MARHLGQVDRRTRDWLTLEHYLDHPYRYENPMQARTFDRLGRRNRRSIRLGNGELIEGNLLAIPVTRPPFPEPVYAPAHECYQPPPKPKPQFYFNWAKADYIRPGDLDPPQSIARLTSPPRSPVRAEDKNVRVSESDILSEAVAECRLEGNETEEDLDVLVIHYEEPTAKGPINLWDKVVREVFGLRD